MEKISDLLSQPLPALTEDPESQPFKASTAELRIEAMEKIFGQFSMHYGAARMNAHWSGLDAEETKVYWARKLSGLSRRQFGFALQHLPTMPPSADEFLAVARRCPPPTFRALVHKPSQEEREHDRARINEIAKRFGLKAQGQES